MQIAVRRLDAKDSIEDLTDLLHDAYRPLGEMGLNYTAVDQDSATTVKRISRGECLVAELNGQIVGTITWYRPRMAGGACAWYRRRDVAVFAQFAVEPKMQGKGVGAALIAEVERRARLVDAAELALDTAEPAGHLIDYYGRRGFRSVDATRWTGKTYRSVIMSKALR